MYCAAIEQAENHEVDLNISPGDVEVLIHREDLNAAEDMIEVNGLLFCKPHRLEVCGSCGMDFRHDNLIKELGDFEGAKEAADELDQALDAINFPNRKAPGSDCYKPVLTPAITTKVIPNNLDPSTLPEWPSALNLETESRRTFGPDEHKVSEEEKLPLRRVRETLVVLGHRVNRYYKKRQQEQNYAALRILLQDEAQSEAVILDILEPPRQFTVNNLVLPLFVVKWGHARASNQDHALKILSTLPENAMMSEIPSELDEISLMAEMLKANAARLSQNFVNGIGAPATLAVSVLTAIPLSLQTAYYEELEGEYCRRCGTAGVKMLRCSQCKQAKYCSRECQKKHWKYHKGSCGASTAPPITDTGSTTSSSIGQQ